MADTPQGSNAPGPNPLLALTPSQVNRAQSEQWRQSVRQALADTRCATPAYLTTDIDPVEQTVTVQIAMQERVRTPTGPQWWDLPPIVHVPVIMPRGGGFAVTLPLKTGDEGLLIFCDTCFDLWWQNGQEGTIAANSPNSGGKTQRQNEIRRHYLHDCGFYPGMWSQKNLLSDFSADSLQIRNEDATTVIDVADDGITITAPALTLNIDGPIDITATGVITITGSDVSITPLTGGTF